MGRTTRRILSITLSFAVTLATVCGGIRIWGVTPDVKEAKAAETTGKYISDVRVSHKSSKAEAEQELGPDYTVLDKDFNDGMSGHAWIGYSTTDNADFAITDMKVMGMDGRYSESDFQTLLDNHKQTIEDQMDIVIPAIIEYAKNYDAGMKTASAVCNLLNMFYEDDSEKNMGDLLLEMGRAFSKNKGDSKTRDTLKKIFVEGNNSVIVAIENLLLKAGDTQLVKNGSWLTRMSLLGPNGLYDIYKNLNSGRSRSSINNEIAKEYGDDAKALLDEMSGLREIIKEAEESTVAQNADDESAVDEMISEVTEAEDPDVPFDAGEDEIADAVCQEAENATNAMDLSFQISNYAIVELLKHTPYGNTKTMYDFFTNENIKKSDLYTMAYVLSDGQKNIVNDVGVFPLFESALSEFTEENPSELEELPDLGVGILSVYGGVDRSVFDGDTAITSETLKNMETKQVKDVLTPKIDPLNMVLAICSALAGICFTGMAIRAFSYEMKETFVEAARWVEKITPVVETMQKNVRIMNAYENAWKIQYLEAQYGIDFGAESLSALEINEGTAAKIEKTYDDIIKRLKANGDAGRKVAIDLEKATLKNKRTFMDFYDVQIRNKMYVQEKYTVTNKFKIARGSIGARVACILGAAAAFAFAGYEIYCMTRKETVEFTHIPAKMVSRTYGDEVNYVTYHATTTASDDTTDLHDKKGTGWQVVYTTTDKNIGDPILASSLRVQDQNTSIDSDEIGLLDFDGSAPSNLTNKTYTGKDMTPVYIFFKTGTEPEEEVAEAAEEVAEDEAAPAETETPQETAEPVAEEPSTEGTVFGGSGMIWIILIIVVVAGGAAGFGIYFRKRRKS